MSLHVGEPAPTALENAEILDAEGRPIDVGSLWAAGPAALVFLRHFGCPACADHVAELRPRLGELRTLRVRIALIGNGEPEHIGPFATRVGLEDRAMEIFTDPTLAAFRAAGLVRSAWATYGPVALFQVARSMTRGHAHLPVLGDATQQGGTVLVDHRGRLAFYHRNTSAGGHAPAADLVDAALAVAARQADMIL